MLGDIVSELAFSYSLLFELAIEHQLRTGPAGTRRLLVGNGFAIAGKLVLDAHFYVQSGD
jgi:hypothetical protein